MAHPTGLYTLIVVFAWLAAAGRDRQSSQAVADKATSPLRYRLLTGMVALSDFLSGVAVDAIQNNPRPQMQLCSGIAPTASTFQLRFLFIIQYNLNL